MTAEQFKEWLALVKPTFRRDKYVAEELGVRPEAIIRWKREGTPDRRTDLACAAILHGLPAWGEEPD